MRHATCASKQVGEELASKIAERETMDRFFPEMRGNFEISGKILAHIHEYDVGFKDTFTWSKLMKTEELTTKTNSGSFQISTAQPAVAPVTQPQRQAVLDQIVADAAIEPQRYLDRSQAPEGE